MAKLDSKDGDILDLPLDAAVDSGDFVAEGEAIIGFAETDGDITADGYTLRREGVFYGAPKANGTAWVLGDNLSHDGTNFLKSSTLDIVAFAASASASSSAVGDVVLLPAPRANPARLAAVEDDATKVYAGGAITTVTGTTAETVSQTALIPEGDLEAGDGLTVTGGAIATSTTSTETVIARLRIGGVTGPIIASTNAQDVANDDEAALWGQVNVMALGAAAASLINGVGFASWDTTGAAYGSKIRASTALDTTAAIPVVLTLQASGTGETVAATDLKVTRVRKAS